MEDDSTGITVSPDIYLLEDVLDLVGRGEFRIPKFQRPFVWRPEQMLSLFDSIEQGYPIGSLLIWQTTEEVDSLDQVGGIEIESRRPGSSVAYVLDGHQRLSTLFGCLRRPANSARSTEQQDWMWWVYRALGDSARSNRYQHWKYDKPVPDVYLPVRSLLRTMDFLGFAREVGKRVPEDEIDGLIAEAEQVAQRIKSYKMSVVRIVGGSLGQAVEVFSRVNSTGQKTSPEQMVSALTYATMGSDSLADLIEGIQERIAASGFGEIPTSTIFQCVLAVSGEEELQQARWELLSRRVESGLSVAVTHADASLERTVEFLRSDAVGVPLARLVPYNLQIMLLTAFFHNCPKPTEDQLDVLRRWFWTTSWAGTFAGANSTQVRNYLQEMKKFAKGEMALDFRGEHARPFPERFDFRSARARAFLLWELRTFPKRVGLDGQEIDPVDRLARSHTETYRHVITKRGVSYTSSPANRMVLASKPGVSLRQALIDLPDSKIPDILDSHGIPREAFDHLRRGDDASFIRTRMEYLAEREREFMDELGARPADESHGEADIDTE